MLTCAGGVGRNLTLPPPVIEVKVGRGNIYSQGIYPLALIPAFLFFTHTYKENSFFSWWC